MTASTPHELKANTLEALGQRFDRLASQQDEATAILLARAIDVIQNLLLNAKPTLFLNPALNTPDDAEFLMTILSESVTQYPPASKRTLLRLRGKMAFAQQLKDAGGTFTLQQVADLLGMTTDAVRKRQAQGKLIAIPDGDHHVYPTFQFYQSGVLMDLPELLATLQTESPVNAVLFFLTTDPDLGMSPLDALKQGTDRDMVFLLAKQFGRQVAR
jgi:hypothetical protein